MALGSERILGLAHADYAHEDSFILRVQWRAVRRSAVASLYIRNTDHPSSADPRSRGNSDDLDPSWTVR